MMRKTCFAILLIPALAWAQPKTPDEWYKDGESQYILNHYEKAISAFEQGFQLENDDVKRAKYLYNIAQSYRQLKDCKNASQFYRRFVSLWDANSKVAMPAKTRKDVEGWIKEADECAQQASNLSTKPPTTTTPPTSTGSSDGSGESAPPGETPPTRKTQKEVAAAHDPSEGEDDEGTHLDKQVNQAPHVISARFAFGGTKVGAGDIDVPVQATFSLVAGHPIPINRQMAVEVGGAFTFTPVPFTVEAGAGAAAQSKTAQLWAAMVDAGVTYEVIPKLGLRGDLGLGALFFAGVGQSQFTMGAPTSGALTMFHVRAAVSGDYAITPNFFVTLPLAFSYSPPKDGLEKGIKALTTFDFTLGLGYRM